MIYKVISHPQRPILFYTPKEDKSGLTYLVLFQSMSWEREKEREKFQKAG
jgi:hypothetical protein